MKILIGGDSWGKGEWIRGDLRNHIAVVDHISHGGLSQYLAEVGHTVINVSQAGASNTSTCTILQNFLETESLKNQNLPDLVLVFQTEYTRDYKFRFDEDWANLTESNALAILWLSRFYGKLSQIFKPFNIPVYVIGGCSDTIWIENMHTHYPGVSIVCQSMVNLIVNQNHRIPNPVFSWYKKSTEDFVIELKKTLPSNKLSDLLDQIDLGAQRENLLSMYPEYFWPDGTHANRHGHKILFDFICEQNIL